MGSVRVAVAFATLAVATVSCLLVTDFADYQTGAAVASSVAVSSSVAAGGSTDGCSAGGGRGGPGGQGGCALGSSENCAYCGHDCLNGSCVDGACTAGQVGNLAGGYALVADDTHLFFRTETGDTVYRIAKTAQDLVSPEPVLTGPNAAWTLLVHGEHLYASTGSFIVRVKKDGQDFESLVSLAPPRNRANVMVVDGDHLYYTSDYTPGLRRVALTGSGGTMRELTVADTPPTFGLVVDSEAFYFAVPGQMGASNGAIMRFAKSSLGMTTTAQPVVESIEAPVHMVMVGDDLYVSSGSQVLRVAKGGGPATSIADLQRPITALATDGCELYVAAGPNDPSGSVVVMSLDGAAVDELHAGIYVFLGGIAGDRSAVFHGGGSGIFRIVR